MKIPATYAFLAIILAACNTVKPDVKLMGSVSPPTAADVVRVVIDQQRNIRANVYVANDVAMVRLDGKQEQRLIGINPVLYPAYLGAFFRAQNRDHDNLNEIAVLATASFGGGDLCYDVFRYNPAIGGFSRKLEDFYCTHG